MMWGRRIVLAVLFILPASVAGQEDTAKLFDEYTRRGIERVYNLEFEGAEQEFRRLVQLRPEHPAGHFFLAMVQWWKILIDLEDERYDDRFLEALDGVITLCDRMLDRNENDVTALFFKGGAIGFQGRLHTHRSRWLAAANAGRKALPIVQTAASLDPGNHDIQLGTGIYNYYAEIVPREYPFVKPLMIFVPAGDREKGIAQLRTASEKGKYAAVEATYFLMQLYFQFEKDYPRALELALRLHGRFPNNMLFHKYVGRCHVALGNWSAVEEVFREIHERAGRGQTGYAGVTDREAVYYLGICAMNGRRHDEALTHFLRCDEISRLLDRDEPSGFMIMANMRMGNIYDLQGKRAAAVKQYRKIIDWKDYMGSVRTAEQYLKNPFVH